MNLSFRGKLIIKEAGSIIVQLWSSVQLSIIVGEKDVRYCISKDQFQYRQTKSQNSLGWRTVVPQSNLSRLKKALNMVFGQRGVWSFKAGLKSRFSEASVSYLVRPTATALSVDKRCSALLDQSLIN